MTVTVESDVDGYVTLYPKVDFASQGDTLGEARDNLIEALTLFFVSASSTEIESRFKENVVSHLIQSI